MANSGQWSWNDQTGDWSWSESWNNDNSGWSWNDDDTQEQRTVRSSTAKHKAKPKGTAKAKAKAGQAKAGTGQQRRKGSNRGKSQYEREALRHKEDHALLMTCQEDLRRTEEKLQLSQGEVWTLELQRDQLQESLRQAQESQKGAEDRAARLLNDVAKSMRQKSDLEAQLKQTRSDLEAQLKQTKSELEAQVKQSKEKQRTFKLELEKMEKSKRLDQEQVAQLRQDHESYKVIMDKKLKAASAELKEERAEKVGLSSLLTTSSQRPPQFRIAT